MFSIYSESDLKKAIISGLMMSDVVKIFKFMNSAGLKTDKYFIKDFESNEMSVDKFIEKYDIKQTTNEGDKDEKC